MKKTYRSSSNISFPLTMGKGYRRINFMPLSEGGSYYISSDKAEIEALDAHPYQNKLFRIESVEDEHAESEKPAEEKKILVVKVNDITDAREYLMDTYGCRASDLRSRKAILDAAHEKDIEFTGI